MAVFGKKEENKDVPDLPTPPSFSPSSPGTPIPDASEPSTPSLSGPSTMSMDSPAPASSLPSAPLPTPPSFSPPAHETSASIGGSQELLTEDIEKIAESIIDEKWNKVKGELDDLKAWKADLDTQITGFKSQLDTLGKRVDDAQNAMMGKVEEYNKSLSGVNVEIQAMGKVFEKVIPQFTENVNKLSDLVEKKSSRSKK